MRTEKDKMLAGQMYLANDPQRVAERLLARERCQALNTLPASAADPERQALIEAIFGAPTNAYVTPPFHCDYGTNIALGANVYFNFNCVVLDVAPVTIGDNVMFGPAVQVYTATHPLDAEERRSGREFAKPIVIGDDAWIGGGAIICPGVTIGARAVIGAGSVVTRDIPADVFAAGNPCRVVRALPRGAT
ncbi:Maltose O-acetyltransferase [Lysobacter dokdonensis DS-58]|uniref:Maltose O-acetyltransferase n=1 Tax=Lysobacter dokdonensis DS-58 TaxID=1300345 RepID=A0A0A2WJB2_9GAMM|nr:sugar O-acetyltransferase [Lysobacter dokdonensis]KGQ20261.1 Maltose O-acetyltransferase [Lysobacter dokdonensis DS-58]